MKKRLKYTLVSLGSLVVLAGIGLGIMYMVSVFLPLSYNHGDIFAILHFEKDKRMFERISIK
ncbi:hypothetical protein [Segatella copri]|uniref:Uncharacterized protein n=1 Tax=Segatella copri TaxID=165179 RepID=A0AAW9T609_9BACT|nr:hypothetical protein [Segatella copri]MQN25888.1 hypothetical protein [Segatella copri]MQN30477.1 hypothetical protein [Segatella copri]MQN38185.1 hypothetical protein [Segatella copri]MQN76086.1 hypothetical protein [Segatella copri]MQO25817.1 hypothetical protein [Segatella copri]